MRIVYSRVSTATQLACENLLCRSFRSVQSIRASTQARTMGPGMPLAVSGVFTLLGQLLGIPRAVRDLGIFRNMPDFAASGTDVRALGVLLAVSGVAILAGLVAVTRRDLTAA
ncbi:hypothetical protein [Nonomuraea cavernae]|uniref:hypothetical protein n=1 Tax=Nonomuraea cavernae TaxID=2045107 RepID=UPI003400B575